MESSPLFYFKVAEQKGQTRFSKKNRAITNNDFKADEIEEIQNHILRLVDIGYQQKKYLFDI